MSIIASIGVWIVGELLFWVFYIVFVTILWVLLFPVLAVVASPFFLLRAALHPSGFGEIMNVQFWKLIDVWMDLSIRLIPV